MRAFNRKRKPKHTTKGRQGMWELYSLWSIRTSRVSNGEFSYVTAGKYNRNSWR